MIVWKTNFDADDINARIGGAANNQSQPSDKVERMASSQPEPMQQSAEKPFNQPPVQRSAVFADITNVSCHL